jgi:CubicO group peptidase (beta-lactamase class C family)
MNRKRGDTGSRRNTGPRVSRRRMVTVGGVGLAALDSGGFGEVTVAQEDTPTADLGAVTPLPLTGKRLSDFEAYVATMLDEVGIPGAAVAVVQDGAVAFLQGFGVREFGRPEPVTGDMMLRIGSVTKSFSALLAATLVDAGRLTWETLLVDLLPSFALVDPELTSRLTVADAFCACTGLPRRDLEFQFRAQELTPELVIESMARLPLTAPFGERFQYNNQLVASGGFAAAVADGGSPSDLGHAYAIALRERVLNPIGMERTTLSLDEVVAGNDYATPHAADITGSLHPMPLLEDDDWIVPVVPTGGLWSSAREVARYVQTELNRGVSPDGVRVVSAENLGRTWQPGVPIGLPGGLLELVGIYGPYGLGWWVGAYGGQRVVWHSGFTLGFSSLVTLLPEAELGVVVLTNGSGLAGEMNHAVTFRLLELAFDQPESFATKFRSFLAGQRSAPPAELGQVDAAEVTSFLGRYENADVGELTLALRAGTLLMTAGGFRSELRPRLDDGAPGTAYIPVDSPFGSGLVPMTIDLQTGDDGRLEVTLTVHDDDGNDLVYRYEPVGATATPAP